jgi:3-hydroxymyristoyl/3-hydroxydecanoyl-(acyl carrier protein) dehydratase
MFDINEISRILPHKYPFLLVDRVDSMVAGESIEGYKNISISDHVFQGHFPGHPIYPSVSGLYIVKKTFDTKQIITEKVFITVK